jgi:hypothetical protein
MSPPVDRLRLGAYVAVALAGLLTGIILGQVGSANTGGASRIAWPAPTQPHPRTLNP